MYVEFIAVIFILFKSVSRTILLYVYSFLSISEVMHEIYNNIAVLFSSQKLTDLQRSFDSDGQDRNVKVCTTIL